MQRIDDLVARVPGDLLYHYTSLVGLEGIIRSRTLHATEIHFLNDTTEIEYAQGVTIAEISDRLQTKDEIKTRFWDRLRKSLAILSDMQVFVACLSTKGDLLSQWRGYCPAGAGFSIGFDPDLIKARSDDQGFLLAPCVYNEEEQRDFVRELLDDIEADLDSRLTGDREPDVQFGPVGARFLHLFYKIAPILKHPAFSEENEWRLISPIARHAPGQVKFRVGSRSPIPYFEFSLDSSRWSDTIRKVVVGPNPESNLAVAGVRGLAGNLHLEVAQSKIPYRGW